MSAVSTMATIRNKRWIIPAFGFLGATPQRELITNNLPVVTIDHGGQVAPTIVAAVHVRHIHGPALVTGGGRTAPLLHAWPGCHQALLDLEPQDLHETMDFFEVDSHFVPQAQQRPQPPIAEGRVLARQFADALRQRLVHSRLGGTGCAGSPAGAINPGSRGIQHAADSPERGSGQRLPHSSDICRGEGLGRYGLAKFTLA